MRYQVCKYNKLKNDSEKCETSYVDYRRKSETVRLKQKLTKFLLIIFEVHEVFCTSVSFMNDVPIMQYCNINFWSRLTLHVSPKNAAFQSE